jgi:hypothetical protein
MSKSMLAVEQFQSRDNQKTWCVLSDLIHHSLGDTLTQRKNFKLSHTCRWERPAEGREDR